MSVLTQNILFEGVMCFLIVWYRSVSLDLQLGGLNCSIADILQKEQLWLLSIWHDDAKFRSTINMTTRNIISGLITYPFLSHKMSEAIVEIGHEWLSELSKILVGISRNPIGKMDWWQGGPLESNLDPQIYTWIKVG